MGDKKVLIVEDEAPLLKAVKIKLEKNNFQVCSARTIKGAFEELEKCDDVDFIWLDHYLIGSETGMDCLKKIKKDKHYKDIPVFVVSNTISPQKIEKYMQLGADKYYTKSDYRLDQIIVEIVNCLKEKV